MSLTRLLRLCLWRLIITSAGSVFRSISARCWVMRRRRRWLAVSWAGLMAGSSPAGCGGDQSSSCSVTFVMSVAGWIFRTWLRSTWAVGT
jgi:hypothetical protein